MGIRIKNQDEQDVYDSVHPDLPADHVLEFRDGDFVKFTRTVREERECEVRRYRRRRKG